jgi:FixJ family two-component response regulator
VLTGDEDPPPAEFAQSLADVIRPIKMSNTVTLYVAVVDDDVNFCRSLGRLLRAAGMHPVTYASAEEFLADKRHPRFDCLLLDVHLGELSGIELGQRLAAEGHHAPFICITAHEDPETRALAEAAGCAAFFQKTDPGAAVLDAIRRVTL